jgi:hypothetical protein
MYKKIKRGGIALLVAGLFLPQTLMADMIFYYSSAILPSIAANLPFNLLSGNTFYQVGQNPNDPLDIWGAKLVFNNDITEVSYTRSYVKDPGEAAIISINIDGDKLIFTESTDDSYIIVGAKKSDYIIFTEYNADGSVKGNTRLYYDQVKANEYYSELMQFTQTIVSKNPWYIVESDAQVYCNGVFTMDGNNNLTVSWNDDGVPGSATDTYLIENGKFITSHDGKTETETMLAVYNGTIITEKITVYDNGDPSNSGNKKWYDNQADAEAYLSENNVPSCF